MKLNLEMDVGSHIGSGGLKNTLVNSTQALFRKRIVQLVILCIIFAFSSAWLISVFSPDLKSAIYIARNKGLILDADNAIILCPENNTATRGPKALIRDGIHIDTTEGWTIRRKNMLEQFKLQAHLEPGPGVWGGDRKHGPVFFQDNWEPLFSCPYERRLGHWGDGGKWVCNPYLIPRPAVVYSLGSQNEFSFETAMYDYFQGDVTIHTFDFGPAPDKPAFVNYHKYFVGPDGVGADGVVSKSVKTILNELNHTRVDIFKIDIEGNEMNALLPLLENGEWPEAINQIQIEIHLAGHFKPTPTEVDKFFTLLSSKYQVEIFHKEPNIKFGGGIATEYALVKVNWKTIMARVHKNME